MGRLTPVSGKEAIKRFQKLGYQVVRQTGSHIRLWHQFDKKKKPLTVPNHPLIGRGLLRKLIRDAEISIEIFNNLK